MKIDAWEYLKQVCLEETLFRVLGLSILIGLFGMMGIAPEYAILLVSIIFAGVHLVGFTWPMAIASGFFGLWAGVTFWLIPDKVMAYAVCLVAHYVIGFVGWKTGFTKWCMRPGVWRNYLIKED